MRKSIITTFSLVMIALFTLILVSCVGVVEPTKYEVTFNADNGTDLVVVTVEEGSKVSRPTDPTKAGFLFDEWFLGNSAYDFNLAVTADLTLIAHYDLIVEPIDYKVEFDTVGGSPINDQMVESGNMAVLPDAPVKADFSFEGWMLDNTLYNFSTPVTADIKLSAKYNYIGIPDAPVYSGRIFNGDFDQMLNNFTSLTLESTIVSNATIALDQPFISVGYSGEIGSDPDGALWKQAGSANTASAAFQYLVLRLRGFSGASVNDLSIGFRLDDNHEVLVVPLTETLDPDQETNIRELDGTWHNYVISITDTLDGKVYAAKTGYSDVDAGGVLVGFHLMNTSSVGSGILEIKDAFFSKVPNPVYPIEGSDYDQNKDYWSGSVGKQVSSYVTIDSNGYYGDYLDEGALENNTHVVLRLRQESTGVLDYTKIKIAPVFDDGQAGTAVAFSDILDLPMLGSSWLNVTIPFSEIYDGEGVVAGYKLINEDSVKIAISQSFLTYLGEYQAVDYPLLDLENSLIFENFNRLTLGTTPVWSGDNEVALANGFSYLISYAGLQVSTINEGVLTLDSTGGDYVDYVVHSTSKANVNEYRYLVFKYKLNGTGTLDNLRIKQKTSGDSDLSETVYANQFIAGLGLPSIPEDMESYPYQDGEWTYLIVDLTLTPGLTTDFGGFSLYYTGASISFDAIFFANGISNIDSSSEFLWANFEGLTLGSAEGMVSSNQWWAQVYGSATTIVLDGETNQALQVDGTGYAQYHTGTKGMGRYLSFDLKVATPGTVVSFRVGPTGTPKWAKDGQLILDNGTPMVVNTDGLWHHYVIDWVASGFELTDTVGFHASDGEIYLLDNLAWFNELPYFDEELVWGTWEWATVGDANGQAGENQWWMNNYGSATSIVEIEGNKWMKFDATLGYVQIHTGVKGTPRYIAFDLKMEVMGGLGINIAGTHKWNQELIGIDGLPITLPLAGETKHMIIDVLLSGLPIADEFGIGANEGAIFYIDNVSFQNLEDDHVKHIVFNEDFDVLPTNDQIKYWWGEWALVQNGTIELSTTEYAATRFGSPMIKGANYLTFDVKLQEGNNADTFRIELGNGNIVDLTTLITDGHASALTTEYQTITLDLSDYVSDTNALEVIGFHINSGGVVIDNLSLSVNDYVYQMHVFMDEVIA